MVGASCSQEKRNNCFCGEQESRCLDKLTKDANLTFEWCDDNDHNGVGMAPDDDEVTSKVLDDCIGANVPSHLLVVNCHLVK